MKKAFTLLELVISITIFMIIIVFMYKSLDDTKITNSKFSEYINKDLKVNEIYQIIYEDIAEKINDIEINIDKNKNSIISFKSKNSYYKPFYTNILYLQVDDKFVRIESLNKIDLKNFSYGYLEDAYVEILLENITSFKVIKNSNSSKTTLFLELKNKEKVVFPIFEME